jgi:methionyl-tRNA formyltransferase
MPIAFFGTADFSAPSLRALLEAGYSVGPVITKPDAPGKRGTALRPPQVKTIADDAGIPVLQPASKEELAARIGDYPDVTGGVVVAYGMLIPREVLDRFAGGLINVHASLLPRWRGASPVASAILHGDQQTGISLMQLTPEMDEGPVFLRAAIDLDGSETRPWLESRLAELGGETVSRRLDDIWGGSLTPEPQDDSRATYAPLLDKSAGEIDWHQSAEYLARQIRAFLGWPGSHTLIRNHRVTIEAARPVDQHGQPGTFQFRGGRLIGFAGDGALDITRLKPAGKSSMTGDAFARGYMRA